MKNKMKIVGNIYLAGVYGMRVRGEEVYNYVGSSLEINDALSRHIYFLKRGLYADTNKAELQKLYDLELLEFVVIHESEQKDNVKNMSKKEKENLDKAMSVLEAFYIELYKETICNSQKSVHRTSSNKNSVSTFRRRRANTGENNPMCKYSEELIGNILWLKIEGYKPKEIEEMLNKKGIDIKSQYINNIGLTKWIHAQPIKPEYIEKEVISFGENTTSVTTFGDAVNI